MSKRRWIRSTIAVMLPIAAVVAANLTSFAINILSDGSGPMPYVLNLIVESPCYLCLF